jgi:hypothetical protein
VYPSADRFGKLLKQRRVTKNIEQADSQKSRQEDLIASCKVVNVYNLPLFRAAELKLRTSNKHV